ncbi:MAG TPA: efflux transporter outer membrane subunit [Stellaceae bacterium]|nr:efflux transporter outer membrane subunit [Stellaceae bacterium]
MLRRGAPVAALAFSSLAWLLAGCTQGPDFASPAPPKTKGYTASGEALPGMAESGGKGEAPAQHAEIGARVVNDWWTLFRSPELNRIVKQALADSPNIAQARATLAQAQEQTIAAAGRLLPQADFAAGVGRQAVAVQPNGTKRHPVPTDVFSIGGTVSYALDIFGGLKRQVEAQEALADVSQYQLAAADLALTGNVALQAITVASLRAQIKTVEDILAEDEKNLNLVKTAQAAGTGTLVDVTNAQSQLDADRTLLPPLHQQLSVARHALAVLVGQTPGDWSPPDFDLSALTLPKDLPVTLPSQLVRNRPDILAAEAQLHVASANIGVATANLYPNVTLNGSIAQDATQLGRIFTGQYSGWSIAANLAAPVFHGGTLKAQQRAAIDAYQAALAGYRQTVIQSFGQVADALQALAHDQEAVASQSQALATAQEALRLARLSFSNGNTGILQVLDAERLAQQAQLGVVRAQAQRYLDTAQLFVALGSGWWNTPPTLPPPPKPAAGT